MKSVLSSVRKPLVLTIDDDPDFNKIMKVLLKRLGLEVVTTQSTHEFLTKLKTLKPALCLIDLTIGQLDMGFTIIKAIRNVKGANIPLIVMSQKDDRQSIAHALEIGANDFIIKPIDQELLASKLSRFVHSESLDDLKAPMRSVPVRNEKAYMFSDVEVVEVDEMGLRIQSPFLITKGTAIYVENHFIAEVTGRRQAIPVTVVSTWVEGDGKTCGAFLEFDVKDEDLRANVRQWLSNRQISATLTSTETGERMGTDLGK